MHFWFHKYVNGEPTILPEAKTQKSYNYTKITLQTLVHNFKQDLYNNIFCINDEKNLCFRLCHFQDFDVTQNAQDDVQK